MPDTREISPNQAAQEIPPAAAAIRAKALEGAVEPCVFGRAFNKTDRTVSNWIAQGLPVIYVGRKPYVLIEPGIEWLRTRRTQQQPEPRRPGRPRKAA